MRKIPKIEYCKHPERYISTGVPLTQYCDCIFYGLIRLLAPRFGEKRLAMAGLVILAVSWLGIVNVPNMWMVYTLAAVSAIGSALAMPTLNALASNRVDQNQQGKLAGVSASLNGLANVIGPLWAGAAYDLVTPTAPFWSSALFLLLAFVMVIRVNGTVQARAWESAA